MKFLILTLALVYAQGSIAQDKSDNLLAKGSGVATTLVGIKTRNEILKTVKKRKELTRAKELNVSFFTELDKTDPQSVNKQKLLDFKSKLKAGDHLRINYVSSDFITHHDVELSSPKHIDDVLKAIQLTQSESDMHLVLDVRGNSSAKLIKKEMLNLGLKAGALTALTAIGGVATYKLYQSASRDQSNRAIISKPDGSQRAPEDVESKQRSH